MENEKLFDFMEKIYTEMQLGFKSINTKIGGLENKIDGLEGVVNKNSIKLESPEKKVDIIAEIQRNHISQNEKTY